ncbi:protein GRAVITROPIC IN THE LIGHT 1-like [Bidens hawaiensis]|uniref:protein GRAVITROPIC IN THE LIGHT 1-like n=1 Tax=Bidens hawaiensis TaxID=980011 RepID=UPI0040494831
MFPNMLCGACKSHGRRNLKMKIKSLEPMSHVRFKDSIPIDMDPDYIFIGDVPLQPNKNKNSRGTKKMAANKVSNFSDLIHRVTGSCMLHPLGSNHNFTEDNSDYEDEQEDHPQPQAATEEQDTYTTTKEIEMVTLMGEVFETVSSLKKSYVTLQEAHCPWDSDKIRLADVAVVSSLKQLGVLREKFRRRSADEIEHARINKPISGPTLREVVAPYEAAIERLKSDMKAKEEELNNLIQKLKTTGSIKSRSHRRVSCSSQFQSRCPSTSVGSSLSPELFEAYMNSVKEGSKSFSLLLLSLMKAAHWDIAATVKSIISASTTVVGPTHAKYSLESYVNRKFFHGFDHETFYMDGSLTSLLNPAQFRSECFTQHSDMKSMDPMELLGIMPTCEFGKFCFKKYLSIVHPKMEESLFGDLEQRRQVLAGKHPRSRFYAEFLGVAKAVWLLHLVAFSMEPLPSHFEGSRGAEFHPEYMESVVRVRAGGGYVVGFPVSPGFKLGNGYVVKARVYLVPKTEM